MTLPLIFRLEFIFCFIESFSCSAERLVTEEFLMTVV